MLACLLWCVCMGYPVAAVQDAYGPCVARSRAMRDKETPVEIALDRNAALSGSLGVPRDARGLVIFAHGSGSSRFSPRNQAVARALRDGGLATLLLDLLTPDEEQLDLRTA